MTETFATFLTRHAAVDCLFKLRAAGIRARLAGNPEWSGADGGLAVAYPSKVLKARRIILKEAYPQFNGFIARGRKLKGLKSGRGRDRIMICRPKNIRKF